MIYIKEYPSQKSLLEVVEYKDGSLYRKKNGKITGKWTRQGYEHASLFNNTYATHRLIYILHFGDIGRDVEIDHVDNNTMNNKIENLRIADRRKNVANSRMQKNNTSGYKGVHWSKSSKLWVAKIGKEPKNIVKYFKNIEDAVEFVKKKRIEIYGEFHNHG